MNRRGRVFVVAVVVIAAGCDSKSEPPSGMPPLAAAALAPSATAPPTSAQGVAGELPAGHPSLGQAAGEGAGMEGKPPGHPSLGGAMPSSHAAGDDSIVGEMPGGEFDRKATITGTIVLSEKVKGQVKPGDVIFLVARQDDGSDRGGAILGVKRFVAGRWPLPFQLDGRDAMTPGVPFKGKVLISARVDKDGDAMTKNPGDVIGVAHLVVPAASAKISIDTLTK